jgi:sarcosine/dimethylglycine N-methyltransferase
LAVNHGCPVTGTNISERELDLARERASQSGLAHLLSFEYEDFHNLGYPEASYDVVWSQEAFLHAADKNSVLSECRRVLKPNGSLIFTDILVRRDTPDGDRERIYDRVKSPDMWDLGDYRAALSGLGLRIDREEDWSQHVARSYGWVRDQLQENRHILLPRIGADAIDRTLEALSFWVKSAKAGFIGWGLYMATKPP